MLCLTKTEGRKDGEKTQGRENVNEKKKLWFSLILFSEIR